MILALQALLLAACNNFILLLRSWPNNGFESSGKLCLIVLYSLLKFFVIPSHILVALTELCQCIRCQFLNFSYKHMIWLITATGTATGIGKDAIKYFYNGLSTF